MSLRTAGLVPLLACLLIAAGAPDGPRPAPGASYTIRWEPDGASAVEVAGIDPANLAALAVRGWDASRWARLFEVTVVGPSEPPAILGTYRVSGENLRFRPRFAIEPGLRHRVSFRPALLPIAVADRAEVTAEFTRPEPPSAAPTSVVRVDPAADRVPENLLKLYLHFSAPMARGEAYGRVRVLGAAGRPVVRPFLELGEELWDRTGTRLTLLFDPGRIKRGLRPRDEEGPILEAGRSYTLVIDRDWPDAGGRPLREPFRKTFLAGPPDETQPDPKSWTVAAPTAGTRDALALTFPEPLDRAMLDRVFTVLGPDGRPIGGAPTVDPGGTAWRLIPDRPWPRGAVRVVIDATLEDLAGNSIARPFEVDVLHPIGNTVEAETVTLPVSIRSP